MPNVATLRPPCSGVIWTERYGAPDDPATGKRANVHSVRIFRLLPRSLHVSAHDEGQGLRP